MWELALCVLLSLIVAPATGATTVSPPDNKGQEFILMFMENEQLGAQKFPLELYVTTQEKKDVHVHVTSPKWSSPKVDETFIVREGVVKKINITAALRMVGSDVSTKGLLITADADVACYGANKETLSNDVYLGLPTDALGTDYYAVVHSPASVKSEIGIASTADNTNVKVTLPSNNGKVDVTFKGHTYHQGETISVQLAKYETLQLQSKGDLTGAHIVSDKPVAALSGNIKTNIGKGTPSDHLVEMLVPSDRWGKQFVTAPIPGRTVGDVYRIVAKEDNTVVTIPGQAKVTLNKGDNRKFELPSTGYNSITSTKPIMLAQFVKSQQSGSEPADPSMMIIPPYEQFGSDYTFTTPEYSRPDYGPTFRYKNEFLIVAKKSETSGLLLDGKPFPQTQWNDIPGTDLVGGYITLPHGAHTVRHSNPLSTFGGYLYGHAYHESYGFPTGMRTSIIYDPNCKVTPSVPGDGIDNDCDNKIDEELCTPDNHKKDDDGDGRIDEDCVKTTPIDGLWGKWAPWASACSVTCGDGVRLRTRKCDAPAPKFGGKNCTGNSTDTKSCYGGTPCGLDVTGICKANPRAVAANPLNCAQYIDCSKTSPLGKLHLFECPYPQLFSNTSLSCDDFEKVNCDRRKEPMAPCEYEQNKCNGTDPTCLPCPKRLASCVGVDDGKQAMSVFAPEYKDCYKNRTMGQGKCDMGYFNPQAHRCMPHNAGTLGFYCRQHKTEKVGLPTNCAKFYNCSKTNPIASPDECPYPDLFSLSTGQCENFTTVQCKTRPEPEAPCEYDQNKCPPTNTTCKCPDVHADCRGKGKGKQAWPSKAWSPDYADCLLNRTMAQGTCKKGYFHPVLKKCMETVKPNEVTNVCMANPTMVFPDPQNCAKFINCSLASSLLGNHVQECKYPDLFSLATGTCEQFESVTCGNRTEPKAPCEYEQNKCQPSDPACVPCPKRLPSCVGQTDGDQAFPTKTWAADYVKCYKSRTMLPIKHCAKGYFHPVTKKCTEDVARPDAKAFCAANPTAVVPTTDNCAQLINCSLASSLLGDSIQECKYPDLFSLVTKTCGQFESVTCGKRMEPKAPCEYVQNKCQPSDPACVPCTKRLPSCVGQTDGDQAFPTKTWAADYVKCYKSRTMLPIKHCAKGYFHPVTKKCTEDVARPDAKAFCAANPTAVVPTTDNCAQFINCSLASSLLGDNIQECKYPDLFSLVTKTCGQFESVTCGKRTEPKAPCDYEQNKCQPSDPACVPCPKRLPSCVGKTDGDQAFPTKMWAADYVKCYKSRTMLPIKHCAKGYFHPVTKKCTEDVARPDAKSFCAANPTAVVPTTDNCAQFINCSRRAGGGMPAAPIQECHYPDLFSTTTLACQDFTTVSCNKRMEPQAPCEYDQNKCAPGNSSCVPCKDRLPSCVSLPDSDQPVQTLLWKPDYVSCTRNRTILPKKRCRKGYFHPTLKQCTEDVSKPDSVPYCKANPNDIIPMKDNCAQLLNCTVIVRGGSSMTSDPVQECQYPDLFSVLTMTCQDFTTVSCGKRPEPQAPCEYKQNLCSPTNSSCAPCSTRLPSCRALADGNQVFSGRSWKPDYVTCYQNRTMLPTKRCSVGYFHPVTKRCTEDVAKPDAKPYCKANPNAIITEPDNCAHYINCSHVNSGASGDPVQECTYPDLFSDLTKSCQDFTTVHCDKRVEPQAPCEYDQNLCSTLQTPGCLPCSQRLPSCIRLPNGDEPFPTKLWTANFVHCTKNRTMGLDKCPAGAVFDPHARACTTKINKGDIDEFCRANPGSIRINPLNCAQYYNCSAATTSLGHHLQECPYPDLFSTATQSCQRFETVDCHNRTEPQAPCEYMQNLCGRSNTSCTRCPSRLPSCVGVADGNQAFPGRLWQQDYVTCYKNRTTQVKKCPTGEYYSPSQKKCTKDVPRTDAKPYCQANPSAVVVLTDNCAQYINCTVYVTGRAAQPVQECRYPDLFSTTTMTCQDFSTVTCNTRMEPKAPCDYNKNKCSPTAAGCVPCPQRLPSCVGLQDGNQPYPGRQWKPNYVTCTKDRTILPVKTCAKGYFHPTKKQCVDDVAPVDAKPYCQANPTAIVAKKDNCAHFVNCSAVLSSPASDPIAECKYPDLFSTVTQTCESFTTVTCNIRPEPQAPCEYNQNQCLPGAVNCSCPRRLPSCVGVSDGAQPFPTRLWARDYVQCYRNRTVAITLCQPGTVFDPQNHACVSDVPPSRMDSYCRANPTAIKVDPANCARYYNCSAPNSTAPALGHHLQECHYPQLFSEIIHACAQFETVNCHTRQEPKAPCDYDQNKCSPTDPACVPCPDRLPSCVGVTDGAQGFPTKPWSADYVTCYKDRTPSVKHCTTGYFHPRLGTCAQVVQKVDAPDYCKAHPTTVLPVTDSCAEYINCTAYTAGGGSSPVQECHYPQLFSTTAMGCQDFGAVQCGKRAEPKAPCEYQQNRCKPNDAGCIPCGERLPSCVGQQDGNHAFPGKLYKPEYVTCSKDRTTLPVNKCLSGFFHPVTEQCTDTVTKPDARSYCQANPLEAVPATDNCAVFYNCTRLVLGFPDVTQECPYPALFSDVSLTCQDFTTVRCGSKPEPQAPCQYSQNLCQITDPACEPCGDRLPSCVGLPDGDQPVPGRSWTDTYLRCFRNRTMAVHHCPAGAVFDPNRRACATKINPGDIDSYCRAHPGLVKPHDTNCAQFYNCSQPQSELGPYLQECPYPDLFSTVTLRCQTFETVPCGTRHEPQPPCEYLRNLCDGTDPSCRPCSERLPSCVGLPDGLSPVPTKAWDKQYVECYKNRTIAVNQCLTGYFHPTKKVCKDTVDKVDVTPYCTHNPKTVIPAEDDCAQYHNCTDPTSPLGAFLSECNYPDLFSRTYLACGPFARTLCDKRPEPQAPCEYQRNLCAKTDRTCSPCPERLPSCVGEGDGARPAPRHLWSDSYVQCYTNRTMAVKTCSTGYFHPTLRRCRTQVDPVDIPDYCVLHPTAVLANPDNCAVFYNCSSPSNGYMTECPYPDLYDVATQACVSFKMVDCRSRPEPMAPCQYKHNQCSPMDSGCIPCQQRLPSCVGLQDGDQPFPGRTWAPDYVVCSKNRTVEVKKCQKGFFNPTVRSCVTTIDKPAIPAYCSAHPEAILPSPDNCARYVNCSDVTGTNVVVKECTYPDLFSADTLMCTKFTRVTCDTRKEPQAPCEYNQNQCLPFDASCAPCPDRLPSCVGTSDGARPFTGMEWTDNYIECFRNRTMALDKCPKGSVFDPQQLACLSKIDKNGIQSYCRFIPTAVKEHPDNCAQYFDCSKPTSPLGPYLMECDYPKLFSSLLGTCADFETVQCGQKTEPKSPCDYLRNLCAPQDAGCQSCQSRFPNCVGQPDGKQAIPDKLWEPDYVTCHKNRTMEVKKCQRGYFNPTVRSCVEQITKVEITRFCRYHPVAVVSDPSGCAVYFNCSASSSPLGAYRAECPYPNLYSSKLQACEQFMNVDCDTRPVPVSPCDYQQNQCSPLDNTCTPCSTRLPTCQGRPDGDNEYPGRTWKADYITCLKNRTAATKKCPHGFFNPYTKRCETTVPPGNLVPYCKANPDGILPNPSTCSQYYNCSKLASGISQADECKYPDLFSTDKLMCESFEITDCKNRPEPQTPCEYDQNLCSRTDSACTPCQARLPSCVGLSDGLNSFGMQQWTSKYVTCYKNRTVALGQCPQKFFFSPSEKKCTQNINSVDITSFCRANPTAVRPHPTNCAQFYDCSAYTFGNNYVRECRYPDLFDSTKLACRKFSDVKCGIRHEPKAPCEYVANQCKTTQATCKPCTQRLPSCVGKTDGNYAFLTLPWQQQYVVCDKERTTSVDRCPGSQIFNPNTRKCIGHKDITKEEIPDYCKAYPNAMLPDPDDCSRYYSCRSVNSQGNHKFQCHYPDLFSVTSHTCVTFNLVQCEKRHEPTAPCEYDHNKCNSSDSSCAPCTVRLPDCTGQPDGNNGIPGMLWSVNYVTCSRNRTTAVKRCTGGVFDPNSRTCSVTVSPQHIRDLCFANPSAIVPHPTNCGQYFDCSKLITPFGHYLLECPYPSLFDATTSSCDQFSTVQCGNKYEPKAPCQYFQNLCPVGNRTCVACKDRKTSCINLPDGMNAVPAKLWSPEYVICSKERTLTSRTCRLGYFDPMKKACVDKVQPVDIPQFCSANPGAVLPDPTSCGRYYNCSDPASNYRHECSYPRLYSEQTSLCDDFQKVFCGERPQPQSPCEYSQNQCQFGDTKCVPCQQRLPSCVGLPDGINPVPNKFWSDSYLQCLRNRTLIVEKCREGLFDPNLKSCVKYIDPARAKDVCRANPNLVLPDPTNCAKYVDCRLAGPFAVQYVRECRYPDLFSTETGTCHNFTTVRCDGRPEPQYPCEYTHNQCASTFNCEPCPNRWPSCVGEKDGYTRYQGRPWSRDYVFCLKNRTLHLYKCPDSYTFDPTLTECTKYIDPANIPDYCRKHPTAIVASMRSAAQFYDCSKPTTAMGDPYLQECSYPDLFEDTTDTCRDFTTVPPDERPVPQAPCEYGKNRCRAGDAQCAPCPQRLYSCVGLPDGQNGIEGKAWVPEYVNCRLNRTLGTGKCPQGVFDPLQRNCVVKTTSQPASIQDQCQLDPTRIIPHPGSCSLFYNCSQDQAKFGPVLPHQLDECSYPDLFSTVYQRCLDFQSVQCDKRNEVEAPCQYLQNQCSPSDPACRTCPERLPSCIGLPDGDNPVTGRFWTAAYIHCFKNRTLAVRQCPGGGFFHPYDKKCTRTSSNTDDLDTYCRLHPTALVPSQQNCAKYHDCSQSGDGMYPFIMIGRRSSSASDGECPYPQLFSTVTKRCEDFIKVNCEKRPEPMAPCEYSGNQCSKADPACEPCETRLPSCIGLPDGNQAVPGREYSDIYLQCRLNRTLAIKHCDKGWFDPGLHICVTQINSANAGEYCKRNQWAVLPHPTNCAWYYNCSVQGHTLQSIYPYDIEYVQECPYPQLFSSATMKCEEFERVSCSGHFEPQAPCEYYKNRCDPHERGCIPCPNRIPSCKTLPDGRQSVPNLYDGLQYAVQCLLNRTLSYQHCQPGMPECAGTTSPPTLPPVQTPAPATTPLPGPQTGMCAYNRGRVVANPGHCGEYYDCTKTAPPYLYECQYPQLFSEVTSRCEDFQSVTCNARPEYKAPCDYQQNVCKSGDFSCTPCPQRFPSCVGLSDGNHAFPGKEGTSAYITCLKGRTMFVGDCPLGVFSPLMKQCTGAIVTSAPTTTAPPDTRESYCRRHPTDALASPSNCAQYYDCRDIYNSNTNIPLRECQYPLLFSTVLQTCADFSMVTCDTRHEPQAPCDYNANQCHSSPCVPCSQRFASCVGLSDGNHAYPGREGGAEYVRCQRNRTMAVEHCNSGLFFDQRTRQCRSYTTTTTHRPTIVEHVGDIREHCRLHPDQVVASPDHCNQYYDCGHQNSQLGSYLAECPYPQMFDDVTRRCTSATSVQCGRRPRPTSSCDYKLYVCIGLFCTPCSNPNPYTPVVTRAPTTHPPTTQAGPNCIGKVNGLNPYPGKELTGFYIVCEFGRVIETGICILNEILDPNRHKCVDPADPAIIDAYCAANPGVIIPSATNCAQFYQCGYDPRVHRHDLQECVYPQLFSTVDNTCKHFSLVQCGQRREPRGPCDYQQYQCSPLDPSCTPCQQRMPSCEGLEDGLHPHPDVQGSVADYIECDTGRTVDVSVCIDGYFNTITRQCINNNGGAIPQLEAAAGKKCQDDLTVSFESGRKVSTELAQKDKTNDYGADRAHLNFKEQKAKGVSQMGGWVAEKNDFNQYIQIELKDVALIRGLTSQGRNGCCQQWVNKYRVLYSDDCKTYHTVGGFNVTDAFFQGNKDEDTPVTNMFHCPVMAKCIRINPLGWNNNIAMRVGILGCQLNLNGATTTVPTTTQPTTTTTTTTPKPTTPQPTTAKPTTKAPVTTQKPVVTTAKPVVQTTKAPTAAPATLKPKKRGCIKNCVQRANGDYQSCDGCAFYVTCNWGIMYKKRPCPKTLSWDDNKRRCELKSSTCP